MGNAVKDLGSELKDAREFQGMTLEDVHHQTKISLKFLRAIENNDFAVLPNVYLRAFLKAYASSVGIEPEKVLKAFDEIAGVKVQEEPPLIEDKYEPESSIMDLIEPAINWARRNTRILLYGAGGIAVIIIAIIIFGGSAGDKASKSQMEADLSGNAHIKNGIQLSVKALENLYLMVSIDGGDSLDYTLLNESSKQFTAAEKLWVLTSNAGAMEIQVNGTPVQTLADTGWAAHFTVDKNGLQILDAYPPTAQVR